MVTLVGTTARRPHAVVDREARDADIMTTTEGSRTGELSRPLSFPRQLFQ